MDTVDYVQDNNNDPITCHAFFFPGVFVLEFYLEAPNWYFIYL